MDVKWLILAVFLVSCPLVLAGNLEIRIYPIEDEISIYDEASYNISIRNLGNSYDNVRVYSPNIDRWTVLLNPSSLYLAPNEIGYLLLRVAPKAVDQGYEYGIQLNIRSDFATEIQREFAYVFVKSQEQINREYLPVLSVDLPEIDPIDPTQDFVFIIDVENKNVREIDNLEIRLRSDVISESIKTSFSPLQKKSLQFNVNIPSYAKPTDSNMIMTFHIGNQTILSRSIPYTIIEVEKQTIEKQTRSSFLKIESEIFIINDGNTIIDSIYNKPTNVLNYLLISGNLPSRLTFTQGRLYKQYYLELTPGETYTLNIIVNYRPVLYTIIIIIIFIILYYLFRSPLVIRKSVSSIKTKEGSLSELKVLIHVKNRTNKVFENIIVLDRIPKITEIGKEFEIGTLKPTKITSHEKKGTIARWEISSLDSYEERVVAYKLYSNLNILGGLTLPIAILKFFTRKGTEKKVISNKIKLVIKKFQNQ
ncbi:MAG: hypothetical protein ACMXYG_00360 [Candidatus Woesearchaeota archaeon]